ncbi:MAG: glycine--tRNA ligase subunit beta [Deltaproteobacteria bacterium]|nr:glycine--tRNA ligase subunit beta [Deltaproteobacteria bacterium]
MAKDLIFEIGTEELPAAFIPKALASLEAFLRKTFEANRLNCASIRPLGGPRRLAFIAEGLDERQGDATVEVKGPQKKAAFDASGNPTPALIGFARSQGVEIKDMKTVASDKGEYAYAVKEIKGRDTLALLPDILRETVSQEVFAKSMRWGSHEVSFARPVHWLCAVYGGIPVEFEWGHIKSGSVTFGHRFHSGKRPIPVDGASSYVEGLRAAFVIADPAERKAIITEGIQKAAKDAGGCLVDDPGLIDEVTFLTEFPVVVRGGFDAEFLKLPSGVVVNAMREHQRYFSLTDGTGRLLPYFITVANTRPIDESVVRKGNERVLRARLNDAKFYFEQDVKKPIAERVEALKGVVFQAKLGTSYEKVERFANLAVAIGTDIRYCEAMKPGERAADFLTPSLNPAAYEAEKTGPGLYSKFVLGRAAMLAKADLCSGMVGEFPKLQGIMGGVYARSGGETGAVATAIAEHYLPTASGGQLPASIPGAVISIADKLDTIVGCFSVGLTPTGGQDPYGLRRSALGIIAIIIDKGLRVNLTRLVDISISLHDGVIGRDVSKGKTQQEGVDMEALVAGRKAGIKAGVMDFFKERLRNMLLGQGLAFDSIDAALAAGSGGADTVDIVDIGARARAIEGFKSNPACPGLVIAFKRVSNILKGVEPSAAEPDPELFKDQYERGLFEAARGAAPLIAGYAGSNDYASVFAALASIKEPVDAFFNKVLVMAEDAELRKNRLALLSSVRNLYFRTADLSKLNA